MVAKIFSVSMVGLQPFLITVEVEAARGLPKFEIIGLAQGGIQESKNRVLSALKNSGHKLGPKKITVNLAPAYLRKEGTGLDLPIALGVAQAMDLVKPAALEQTLALGELSLDGSLKKIHGAILIAQYAKKMGFTKVVLPWENAEEAVYISGVNFVFAKNVGELLAHLNGETVLPEFLRQAVLPTPTDVEEADWSEIASQDRAKRALEIAAAGHHNVLMIGPPGVGKTFIAKRFSSLLPPLTENEMLERLNLYSLRGSELPMHSRALFRAPHHSASLAGMVGGGRPFRPGELSLAHKGVLFLDEMVEFRRDVLELLRQPLESGALDIVRSEGVFALPADFIFIGACNRCPCGALGDQRKECHCSVKSIRAYWNKLSAPILDRFDMIVELTRPTWDELQDISKRKTSEEARKEIDAARAVQKRRNYALFAGWNGKLSGKALKAVTTVAEAEQRLLAQAMEKWGMSIRSVDKVLRVARTIADLSGEEAIQLNHLTEALQYRHMPQMHG